MPVNVGSSQQWVVVLRYVQCCVLVSKVICRIVTISGQWGPCVCAQHMIIECLVCKGCEPAELLHTLCAHFGNDKLSKAQA